MSRYLVKDKFTYERVPQTDYSYNPDYLPYCGLTDVCSRTTSCCRSIRRRPCWRWAIDGSR